MAKSLRSKREKRLRTLRREIAEPFYDKKEAAKLAAQAAALEAPPLPVRGPPSQRAGNSASAMGVSLYNLSGLPGVDCYVFYFIGKSEISIRLVC